jgi:hypothetical protein
METDFDKGMAFKIETENEPEKLGQTIMAVRETMKGSQIPYGDIEWTPANGKKFIVRVYNDVN